MATTDSKKQFNVELNAETRAMLDKIAEKEDEKLAQVVRKMIRWRYNMIFGPMPTCASGEACKCPQMHTLIAPQQAPNPLATPQLIA